MFSIRHVHKSVSVSSVLGRIVHSVTLILSKTNVSYTEVQVLVSSDVSKSSISPFKLLILNTFHGCNVRIVLIWERILGNRNVIAG